MAHKIDQIMDETGVWELSGVVQHYKWGGRTLIPSLLGIDNHNGEPWAEWWLGAHLKGPSHILVNGDQQRLDQLIEEDPLKWLGEKTLASFGPRLPFLLKVLDVRHMLSIQLHPSIPAAQEGFAKEEAKGIPRLSPYRNYKDRNHKPEFMLALTDFWLLHGFKDKAAIVASLHEVPGWDTLQPILEKEGIRGFYQHVMELPKTEVTRLLRPLFDQLSTNPPMDPASADFWAWEAFQEFSNDGEFDRGIFSIYWLNLVQLKPGQGIFQAAGIPHAYLRGANIELMANSDNVLRGGLTAKHIDVKELLANMAFHAVEPFLQQGEQQAAGIWTYPVPVSDFVLAQIRMAEGEELVQMHAGPSIYLVYEGCVEIADSSYGRGQAFYVLPGQEVTLKGVEEGRSRLFCASPAIS